MTVWKNGVIIDTRRKKSKAVLECKNPAEMQKGLEPRDTKRVCRLGLRDNIDKHTAEVGSVRQGDPIAHVVSVFFYGVEPNEIRGYQLR